MHELNEKCGVFGVFGPGMDVSRLTFYGLFALQHRGQEATGMCVTNGTHLLSKKGIGLVSSVYTESDIDSLLGHIAIGHNRYSTSNAESSPIDQVQPYVCRHEKLSIAHNGNLPSTKALEDFLKERGIDVTGYNDSKLMHLAIECYMNDGNTVEEAVIKSYPLFTGAFSLLVMTHDTLIGVRDQFGMRPLSVGMVDKGYAFASETCALKTIGASLHWEVGAGEMIVCTKDGLKNAQIVPPKNKLDIFEFVYFSRPDSYILGQSVYKARWSSGYELAKEFPIEADIVVPIPETAIPSAIGYSNYSKIPFELALIKNRYINRTFIEPNQHIRKLGVALKLNIIPTVVRGKRVIIIDDSIVRSTTSEQLVKMLFQAGAKEVHFLVSSPPVKYPDFYGIDTPKQEDLIASQKSVEEIREKLGATSLHYLSLDGLVRAIGVSKEYLSTSCFTGEYPIDIGDNMKNINFNV